MKDTIRKGVITETKAILMLLKLGYNIFTPYGDGSKCDLIAQDNKGQLLKLQCKTSRIERDKELFNAYSTSRTRSSGSKLKVLYTKTDIDYYCTFDSNDNMYLIPVEEVKTQTPHLKNFEKYIAE